MKLAILDGDKEVENLLDYLSYIGEQTISSAKETHSSISMPQKTIIANLVCLDLALLFLLLILFESTE